MKSIAVKQKVKLLANIEEGFPEEIATIIDIADSGVILVEVDEEYFKEEFNDGRLREVTIDQIEKL